MSEIASADLREAVSLSIRQAADRRLDDWFLVTSRYAGFEDNESLNDAASVVMHVQPLDRNQQREFVVRWYRAVERQVRGGDAASLEVASKRSAELTEVLGGADFRSQRLASMVANPLLLSILCLVHRKNVTLPRRRSDLYEKCVAVLLESWRHEWRRMWSRDDVDVGVARRVLQAIAWFLHQQESRAEGHLDELVPVVDEALRAFPTESGRTRDGANFLEAIRNDSGILVSASPGHYGFLHQTFQEYLAARHAVESLEAAELAAKHASSWWREPILLALSQPSSDRYAREFFEHLVDAEGLEEEGELLSLLFEESLFVPVEPFLLRLRSGEVPVARRMTLLRPWGERWDGQLLEVVQGLAAHPHPQLAALAREVLAGAGLTLPERGALSDRERDLLEELTEGYYADLLEYVRERLTSIGGICEPEDIVQDVLARAARDRRQPLDRGHFYVQRWLRMNAAHRVAAILRREHFWPQALAPFENDLVAPERETSEHSEQDAQSLLFRAIAALSPRQRTAIQLRLDGASYEEIGREMGCTVNAVHLLISRARAEIARFLEEFGEA